MRRRADRRGGAGGRPGLTAPNDTHARPAAAETAAAAAAAAAAAEAAHDPDGGDGDPDNTANTGDNPAGEPPAPAAPAPPPRPKSAFDDGGVTILAPPLDGSCVYLSGLSWWTTEHDVEALVRSSTTSGMVKHVEFMADPVNGKSRGWAIVETNGEEESKALAAAVAAAPIKGKQATALVVDVGAVRQMCERAGPEAIRVLVRPEAQARIWGGGAQGMPHGGMPGGMMMGGPMMGMPPGGHHMRGWGGPMPPMMMGGPGMMPHGMMQPPGMTQPPYGMQPQHGGRGGSHKGGGGRKRERE